MKLTFPITDNPYVTVLLPTRGRPEWLVKSVDSLHSQSVRPEKIEYLFRVDSDDKSGTLDVCMNLCETLPNARTLMDRRGSGFKDMHHWINTLCKLARGDWLLIWNDDVLMRTDKWDEILSRSDIEWIHPCSDVFMFVIPTINRPNFCNEFMFLRRKVVEILGHWSLSPHNDNWITRVMTGAQSYVRHSFIAVEHFSDTIGDKTREESEAAYGMGSLAKETLESEWAQEAIKKDIVALREQVFKYWR